MTVGKTDLTISKVVARPRNRVASGVHIPPLIDGLCLFAERLNQVRRRRHLDLLVRHFLWNSASMTHEHVCQYLLEDFSLQLSDLQKRSLRLF